MSKFWGDEDTDTTDVDHDTSNETQKIISNFLQSDIYLVSPTDKVKKTKRGRTKKQKCPKTATEDPAQHHNSLEHGKDIVNTIFQTSARGSKNECIQTCAKSGISKAYKT